MDGVGWVKRPGSGFEARYKALAWECSSVKIPRLRCRTKQAHSRE